MRTQPLEYFDINDYGPLWNLGWKLSGAGRGDAGTTYLDGGTRVTYPRDVRPCVLERTVTLAATGAGLALEVGFNAPRPWRSQVMVDDSAALDRDFSTPVAAASGEDKGAVWVPTKVHLSEYVGKTVLVRLYQWAPESRIPGSAYWRKVQTK